MYIKRETNIVITDEECRILKKAREILMTFEDECSSEDIYTLQEKYDEYVDYINNKMALPTAIDLLTVILGDNGL